MKLLIILQIVLALLLGPPSVYVKGKGYAGYIFKKEYFVMGSIENQQGRFTLLPPSLQKPDLQIILVPCLRNKISKA